MLVYLEPLHSEQLDCAALLAAHPPLAILDLTVVGTPGSLNLHLYKLQAKAVIDVCAEVF